jgi:hypothetical protein
MNRINKCGQQGDVNIWEVKELPKNAAKTDRVIIREGEATGHHHKLVGTKEQFEVFEADGRVFAVITEEGVSLEHQTHHSVSLSPGKIYEFGPTYEYDYEKMEKSVSQD